MAFSMFPQLKHPNIASVFSSTSTNPANKENAAAAAGGNQHQQLAPQQQQTPNGGGFHVTSDKCCMHLENLPVDINTEGVSNFCRQYGEIRHVKQIHQRAWIVTFSHPHHVDLAVLKINNDPTVDWRATHKKPSSKNSVISTTSVSDNSSLGGTPATRAAEAIAQKPTPPKAVSTQLQQQQLVRLPLHQTNLGTQLNWSGRRFAGPYTQPIEQPVPRGAVARTAAMASTRAERLHLYSDDPATMEQMRQLAEASGGERSKLEYSFHGLTSGSGKTYLQPLDPRADGPCGHCKHLATAACDNCGDFYCSVECQRADWPKHRMVCAPMPRLVITNQTTPMVSPAVSVVNNNSSPLPPTGDLAALSLNPAVAPRPPPPQTTVARYPAPLNNSPVIIAYASDHRRIFIRSAEPAAAQDYLQTVLDACEAGETAEPLTRRPAKATFVLAFYETTYYRAVVTSNDPDADATALVDCVYIDFGNKQSLPLSQLFRMPEQLYAKQLHPVEVQLAGVPERQCTEAVGRMMADLVDSSAILQLNFEGGDAGAAVSEEKQQRVWLKAPVRLTVPETNECINDRMCALNHVEVIELSSEPLWLSELQRAQLETKNDVELVVMDASLLVYNMVSCVRKADQAQLLVNNQRFQEYCGRAKGPYTPRVNELCLVRSENGVWYRASCVELAGDRQPTLQLIDYGNMMTVNIDHIRKMPVEFAYTMVTFDFMIDGIDEVTAEMLPILSAHFVTGKTVRVDRVEAIKAEESLVYVLRCEDLLAKLPK